MLPNINNLFVLWCYLDIKLLSMIGLNTICDCNLRQKLMTIYSFLYCKWLIVIQMLGQVEMITTLRKYLNKRLVNISYGLEEVFKKVVSLEPWRWSHLSQQHEGPLVEIKITFFHKYRLKFKRNYKFNCCNLHFKTITWKSISEENYYMYLHMIILTIMCQI